MNYIQVIEGNQELIEKIEKAQTLTLIIYAGLQLALRLAVKIIEKVLAERAQRATGWPNCPVCARRLRSKGFVERQIMTIIGVIHWERRVGRCPNRCEIGYQIAPLDSQLGLTPYQATSIELCQVSCLLAVFVPYETASILLERLLQIKVSPVAIWTWVQKFGKKAIDGLSQDLERLNQGILPLLEPMSEAVAQLPLIIGADGVDAPFRPYGGSPNGKIVWKEVKVGILARMGQRITRRGEIASKLEQRRLVAVRGSIDLLRPRLQLEALRQGILTATTVVWLSDGGRGFWTLFYSYFAALAIGILDFYHAAQNLWKAAAAWFDGRTTNARTWFAMARHQLRHGQLDTILLDLVRALLSNEMSDKSRRIVCNLYDYLWEHREHMHYSLFKDILGVPIGSGIVESACKWLIQQRFKGVGMRWSERGFDNLLHLRLAWVNGRFDSLFQNYPFTNAKSTE